MFVVHPGTTVSLQNVREGLKRCRNQDLILTSLVIRVFSKCRRDLGGSVGDRRRLPDSIPLEAPAIQSTIETHKCGLFRKPLHQGEKIAFGEGIIPVRDGHWKGWG
ncbi:uncharacterized protein Dmul_32790 [Desulfococcus multivorans]|nr:uncharacterized protein Dmul_32790 [Desulfococcus multivorans]